MFIESSIRAFQDDSDFKARLENNIDIDIGKWAKKRRAKNENRSASEITAAILSMCQGGTRISTIMLHARVSHNQARSYLSELLLTGFLTLDAGESTIYTTTPEKACSIFHIKRGSLLDLLA